MVLLRRNINRFIEVNEMDISTAFTPSDRVSLLAELLSCGDLIPIWVYSEDGDLLWSSSEEEGLGSFFEGSGRLQYMREYFAKETAPIVLSSFPGVMWCAARGEISAGESTAERYYVLGPVTNRELSEEAIKEAVRKMNVMLSRRSEIIRTMQNIPVVPSTILFQYALMLHFCACGEKLQRSDIAFQESEESGKTTEKRSRSGKNAGDKALTYRNEQRILDNVRQGNLDYASSLERANRFSGGVDVSTGDPLQQGLISTATFVALCTRAAIEGGLPPDTAYTVGDSYIESMASCTNMTDMRAINHAMYRDFIERVHKLRMGPSFSKQITSCINYIEMNVTEELSIRELARRTGYTAYYLSHKFKEETGVTVGSYIRAARIERAKSLLANTDMPVNRIAEDLHFCSGSYFSAKFEEAVGVLPNQYRREKQRI